MWTSIVGSKRQRFGVATKAIARSSRPPSKSIWTAPENSDMHTTVPIDSSPNWGRRKAARRKPVEANQHTRRSWVKQFLLGCSVAAVAQREGVARQEIEQELREAVLGGRRAA